MARISVETEGLYELVQDMTNVDARLRPDVASVLKRGATNIANDMRDKMRSSTHFKGFASGISYDMVDDFEAEIGPERKPSPGAGANIAYFGTPRGGGTVEDPEVALEREIPAFEKHMLDIAERALG